MLGSLGPALIGLLGVLVSFGISTFWGYMQIIRKEKSEAIQEKIKRAKVMRQISRLLADEFSNTIQSANATVNSKYRSRDDYYISNEVWTQYKDIFAAELTFDEWTKLTSASLAIQLLRSVNVIERTDCQIADHEVKFMGAMIKRLNEGIEMLSNHTGK